MSQVLLHVYDVTNVDALQGLNKLTKDLVGAGGAFHSAVEVVGISGGDEWNYGACDEGTGVGANAAKECDMHRFNQTVEMGETSLSKSEVLAIVKRMSGEYPGSAYHIIKVRKE